MDDLERTFREGLRDAAAKKPPLGPIDIDDVTSRPGDVRRRRPSRWLAAAAAVVLVAGIGVGAYLANGVGAGVPAVPAAPTTPPSSGVAGMMTVTEVTQLTGSVWDAIQLDGKDLVRNHEWSPLLKFREPRGLVEGEGPCSMISGTYRVAGGGLTFPTWNQAASDCKDAQAAPFQEALDSTVTARVGSGKLELLDAAGEVRLLFIPLSPTSPSGSQFTPMPTTPPSGTCVLTDVGGALSTNRVSVRVFDDGAKGGLAKQTSLLLRYLGFRVTAYGQSEHAIGATTIRGSAADSPEVQLVQHLFPGAVIEADGRTDHSVDLLVADDPDYVDDPQASVPVPGPLCLP